METVCDSIRAANIRERKRREGGKLRQEGLWQTWTSREPGGDERQRDREGGDEARRERRERALTQRAPCVKRALRAATRDTGGKNPLENHVPPRLERRRQGRRPGEDRRSLDDSEPVVVPRPQCQWRTAGSIEAAEEWGRAPDPRP